MLADTPQRYGFLTRLLHWSMALLFGWQFAGMIVKELLGRHPLTGFWVGTHTSIGSLLFLLILVRIGWALAQRSHRPAYDPGIIGRLAAAGHFAMYVLMVVVPTLGLLRLLGDKRPGALFGFVLRPGGQPEVPWMTGPANAVHSTLAWLLLFLIAGHVAMVLVHRFIWKDETLGRMIGRAERPSAASEELNAPVALEKV